MKHKTITQLPLNDRPDFKCEFQGPEALTDAELLAIIFRTGTSEETSVELARRVLQQEGTERSSILNLFYYELEDLKRIRGIGKVKALQIKAIIELSKRIAMTTAAQKISFRNPSSIAGYYMEGMRHSDREKVVLLMLDSACRLIREEVLSIGIVNAALFSPREVFLEAMKYRAVNIILLHNHPSGDPTPSRQDIEETKRVKEAGELMGIPLLDHIIVGDRSYISMNEEGIL